MTVTLTLTAHEATVLVRIVRESQPKGQSKAILSIYKKLMALEVATK